MKIRVVQIWGFLMTVLGWIFIACTMAMEGWKITSIGGMGGSSIIKVAWYWSSLWRACFTDSTAVSNCYDFPVLWSVEGHIQIVRGLLMSGLSIGMLGFVLSLMGMECTYIGGKDRPKYRKIYAGGICHVLSGLLAASGYIVYAQYVSGEYFNPHFDGLKFDLGTPIFLGWVGSAFHMTGGVFYLWSACNPLCGGEQLMVVIPEPSETEQNKSTTALSAISEIISKTKVSSVSELSSNAATSDISTISSRSGGSSKSGRRSGRSEGSSVLSGGSSKSYLLSESETGSRPGSRSGTAASGRSSRTSGSVRSESRSSTSSRSISSLSSRSQRETKPFIKSSNI